MRFSESERYDINLDCEVVRFMATTGLGSYFAEIPLDKTLAAKRRQFRTKAVELMQEGLEPGEISFA